MNNNSNNKLLGLIQLAAVLVFIIGSFAISQMLESGYDPSLNSKNNGRKLFVKTIDAIKTSKNITFEESGVVFARGEVDIISEVSGRVIEVDENFYTGGSFKKDNIVFEIDPIDFELEVNRLNAEVARAKTDYDVERAESFVAIAEWYQLHPKKLVPELVARKPQLAQKEAELKAAKAQLENAKLDLKRTQYKLPFSGKILNSDIALGQYLVAGQSYGKVYDIKSLEVESSFDKEKIKWLLDSDMNMNVEIEIDNFGNKKIYQAKLSRGVANLESTTRFANVVFKFLDSQELTNVIPGQFANVKIIGRELKDVFVLPESALQDHNIIWQVDENSTLKQLEAEIIDIDSELVIVKTNQEKAKIVIGKISGAYEGLKVNLVEDGAK